MGVEILSVTLFFVGDNKENAFAGLGFDDYDDAVECALDNEFSQMWEAEFKLDPSTVALVKEF